MNAIFPEALGKLHPLVVHFPITLGIVLPILWLWERFVASTPFPRVVYAILWILMTVTTGISILAGEALEEGGGYPVPVLEAHERGAYAVLVISLIGGAIHAIRGWKKPSPILPVILLAVLLAVSFTGHQGGRLTHGEQYLEDLGQIFSTETVEKQAEPPPRKRFTRIDSALVYEELVRPILDENCVSCHGPGKQSGGLRVDSLTTLLQKSHSGLMCIPGSSQKSELIHRMELDESNSRRMPPEAPPVSGRQIQILAWWIDQGMPAGKKLAALSPGPEIRRAVSDEFGQPYLPKVYFTEVEEAKGPDLEKARQAGFRIARVVRQKNFLDVRSTSLPPDEIHGKLSFLKPMARQIARLDLSYARLDKEDLEWIFSLPHLERLSLRNAQLPPPGLDGFQRPPFLENVNLSGTGFTVPSGWALASPGENGSQIP